MYYERIPFLSSAFKYITIKKKRKKHNNKKKREEKKQSRRNQKKLLHKELSKKILSSVLQFLRIETSNKVLLVLFCFLDCLVSE